jgi:hypothetical protein
LFPASLSVVIDFRFCWLHKSPVSHCTFIIIVADFPSVFFRNSKADVFFFFQVMDFVASVCHRSWESLVLL